MIDYILGLWANQWIAFGLYWLPLAFCGFGYLMRTARNVAKERRERDEYEKDPKSKYFSPRETVGRIIGRGLVSVIPVANLCAAIFDVAPEVFGKFVDWLSDVFDQPIVPKRKVP